MRHRTPEIVDIARRTMERMRFEYDKATYDQRDAWRLAQHVLAEYDQRALAEWTEQDRILTLRLSISEIEVAMSRDPEALVMLLTEQARASLMNKIVLRRSAGKIASKIEGEQS